MSDYRTTLLAENEKLRAEVEHWRERFDENEKAMRSAGKAGMLASEAIRTLDEERDEARAEVERAKRALLAHGFTDCGGVEWKPPLGPHPGTLLAEVERLRAEANARAVEELRLQAEGCDTAAAGWARELKVQTDQAHRDRLESRINQLEGVAFHIRRRIAELSKPAAKESEPAKPVTGPNYLDQEEWGHAKPEEPDWTVTLAAQANVASVRADKARLLTLIVEGLCNLGREVRRGGRISSKLTVKLMEDLPSLLDELADLRAYKERTEAGLHKLSGMIDHFCDVTEDEMRAFGLWRDPPQAEVQP